MMLPFPSPFMLGIEGPRATRETVRRLRETGAASVLLLARNIEEPGQVRSLIAELRRRLGRPLLFAVDHEGGWVLRFRSGLTAFPGNGALGRAGDARLAEAAGRRMGRELRALGIGFNLAPVLDVSGPRYNPGIGIRSFGCDPALVSRLGAAFVRGQNVHMVAGCAKHFPGKGEADLDAHVDLPTIRTPRRRHFSVHIPPFRAAVRAGIPAVMTSHAVWPSLDPGRQPATFSRRITEGLLREDLGFRGVVVSDDLCMGAVARHTPIHEASIRAIQAGHDLLIVAHAPELQYAAVEAVAGALSSGQIERPRWEASRRRLRRLIGRYSLAARGPLPTPDRVLPVKIARAAVELLRRGSVRLPLDLRAFPRITVLWPDLRELRDRFTFEGGPRAPLLRLKRQLARWPARVRFAPTPVTGSWTPRPAGPGELTLFFCFEARRFPGQLRALKSAQSAGPDRLVALLLRSPWDLELLDPRVTTLTAHGYRDCQIQALVEALR